MTLPKVDDFTIGVYDVAKSGHFLQLGLWGNFAYLSDPTEISFLTT